MDAAYAVLLDEYVRMGIPLLDAIDQTAHFRAGGKSSAPAEKLESETDRALRELQQMMGGL